jgi:ABC-type transport system involved in multi-copper enzyme maturation permease subunit
MTGAIARFEIRYHLRQPLFYILSLVFALLAFFAVASDDIIIGGAIGNVHRNAPFVTMQLLLFLCIFGVLTTTAFVANSVLRDFDIGIDPLFFSSPIRKGQYLAGRFLGSYFVSVLMFAVVALAVMLGSLAPWLDPETLGPFDAAQYLFSLIFIVAPSLFLISAIFFAVAALTRSMLWTYVGNIAFIVGWIVSRALLRDVENETISTLLDPFGLGAFSIATRYWTVFQKNTQLLPLSGPFLWNRLLWIGVALPILALTLRLFNFSAASTRVRKTKVDDAASAFPPHAFAIPRVSQLFGGGAALRQYSAAVKLEASAVLTSIPFFIILLLGVLNIWGNANALNRMFGTSVYPVTHLMVSTIAGGFSIFAVIVAAFFAGDLVFRERTLKLNEVYDAMPAPTWVLWAAKFTGLLLVSLLTLLTGVVTAVVIQLAHRYTNLQWSVYASGLALEFGTMVFFIAGLSFALQVLTNNKYVGFLGILLYLIMDDALVALGFEHTLYRFGANPPGNYSDMNGWGHFAAPRLWLSFYWTLFLVMLLTAAHLFWVRGTDGGLRPRLAGAKRRFGVPAAATLVLAFAAFASTGCYIYYNTNVLNRYRTAKDNEKAAADYEKTYKKYQGLPQPRITAVQADVDIRPERREVDVRGRYTLVNKTTQPIRELHLIINAPFLTNWKLHVPGAKARLDDRKSGYAIYTLTQPLAPGASMPLTFESRFAARGFVNGTSNTRVVANGTFFDNSEFFPSLGYREDVEIQDPGKRRKYGLKPIQRLAPPTDMKARMNNQISRDSDWISLDTTVSTVPDQIAIAPGYLQKEWTANGRRYFHYKTTSPILGFWSYLSARYTVKRGRWRDIPIEVYYDAKHPYNIDRMIYGVQKSLDYFTAHFSPYQHKQVRILEFPNYATFAQSFPNTIPYSESIGFIADLRDKESIDYVFYVTAHEVAHQWWAHQVIGGNVQGSTMLVETMAQYSALMVMEKEYGRDKMQKFLRYELDRYLRDRGSELVAEQPLVLVENQGYIHYRKGSLVMYELRDLIGEAAVNRALAKFLRAHAFHGPPYPTAQELVTYFRAEARPDQQEAISDLFERITLYDNRTTDVTSTQRPDGKYTVTLKVASTKLRSDARGEEKEVPVNDWIDIGVFGDKEKVLFSEKRQITKGEQTFTIVVNGKPAKAGIDPFNKLIDRNPKDNVKSL